MGGPYAPPTMLSLKAGTDTQYYPIPDTLNVSVTRCEGVRTSLFIQGVDASHVNVGTVYKKEEIEETLANAAITLASSKRGLSYNREIREVPYFKFYQNLDSFSIEPLEHK